MNHLKFTDKLFINEMKIEKKPVKFCHSPPIYKTLLKLEFEQVIRNYLQDKS